MADPGTRLALAIARLVVAWRRHAVAKSDGSHLMGERSFGRAMVDIRDATEQLPDLQAAELDFVLHATTTLLGEIQREIAKRGGP
jgi:hypothetical protein